MYYYVCCVVDMVWVVWLVSGYGCGLVLVGGGVCGLVYLGVLCVLVEVG